MQDQAAAAPAPAASQPVAQWERFPCRKCGRPKQRWEFGTRKGKRDTDCLVCRRKEWTEQRRRRLEVRQCMRCRQKKPFDAFPEVQYGKGRRRRTAKGMVCTACVEERAKRPKRGANGQLQRRGIDYTVVAHAMLFPEVPDFHALSLAHREGILALAKEMARRFSGQWNPLWDLEQGRRPTALEKWARQYLDTHAVPGHLMAMGTQQTEATHNAPQPEQPDT